MLKNDIVSVVRLEAKSCKKGLFDIAGGGGGNTQAINRLRTLNILKVRPEAIVRGNEAYVKAMRAYTKLFPNLMLQDNLI